MRRVLTIATVITALIAAPAYAKSGAGHGTGHGAGHSGHSASHHGAAPGMAHNSQAFGVTGFSDRSGSSSSYNNAHYRNPPPSEPMRRVSEQDCSKPIALDDGNLKCK